MIRESLSGPDNKVNANRVSTQGSNMPTPGDHPVLPVPNPQPGNPTIPTTLSGPDIIGLASRTDSAVTPGSKPSGPDDYTIGSITRIISWEEITPFDTSSPYYFYGSMSEEVLHRYLDRAMEMCRVSMAGGALAYLGRAPYTGSVVEHNDQVEMITRIGAKFVAEMMFVWNHYDELLVPYSGLAQFEADCNAIHAQDPEVICQANVYETIYATLNKDLTLTTPWFGIPIPPYVLWVFGYDPAVARTFIWDKIGLQDVRDACISYPSGDFQNMIDITRPEAQMWVYYVATASIECGAESIYITGMNCVDYKYGNASLHYVTNLIREYARHPPSGFGLKGARRKLVLLCGGDLSQPHQEFSSTPGFPEPQSMYYDPVIDPFFRRPVPLPPWQRQLIFDLNRCSIQEYVKPNFSSACRDNDSLPVEFNLSSVFWKEQTVGGLHPLGWLCAHTPCIVNNDNDDGPLAGNGCHWYEHNSGKFWGSDCASWFLTNSSHSRDKIIPYFYYGMRCININTYYLMPGRLLSQIYPKTGMIYTANNFGQDITIENTWNGRPATPLNWVYHNFTFENVIAGLQNPASDLVRVGTDKMFYIANDGTIFGYLRVGGSTYNDGTWLFVNVPYAAESIHGTRTQVRAKSDLVVNPSGSMLLYIGVDGYIHGYNINSAWDYSYFDMMKTDMVSQGITAYGSLIFPADDRIYYIGAVSGFTGIRDGTLHVHGFIQHTSGSWSTVSPSYSANDIYGEPIRTQVQAQGGLTYHANEYYSRIFYRGVDGLLYYYWVIDLVRYMYLPCPGNADLIAQQLNIVGNLAIHYHAGRTIIYYVARYLPLREDRIHCMIVEERASAWHTNSPSYEAVHTGTPLSAQVIPDHAGNIAVNTDGSAIAYAGGGTICYYRNIDDVYYAYGVMTGPVVSRGSGANSLQFIGNGDLFFIAPLFLHSSPPKDGYIGHFKYQEDYCLNPAFLAYPG